MLFGSHFEHQEQDFVFVTFEITFQTDTFAFCTMDRSMLYTTKSKFCSSPIIYIFLQILLDVYRQQYINDLDLEYF